MLKKAAKAFASTRARGAGRRGRLGLCAAVALMLGAMLAAPSDAQQRKRPLDPAEFTQAVVDAFAAQDPPIEAQSNRMLSVRLASARPGQPDMTLNSIYRDYLKSPKDLDDILGRFVSGIYGTVAAPEFTREDRLELLPILRSDKWMKDAAEKAAAGGTLLSEKWAPGVFLLYGVERDGVTAFLREEDLEKIGVPPRALLDLAKRNLKRLAESYKTHFVDPFWVIEIDRKHEASMLLLDQWWDDTYLGVSGDVIAAIPANGILAIGSADEWDQVDRLRQMASSNYAKQSYGVSSQIFIRRNGRFYPYAAGGGGERRSGSGSRRSFWFFD